MRTIIVQIISAPIACKEGVKDSWRETAHWVSGQLHQHFGDNVLVQYFDLFDPACPTLSDNAQLPFVLVNADIFSSGGKISIPALRQKIEYIMNKEPV